MGVRAQEIFSDIGIKVVVGALWEDPKQVVKDYLNCTLKKVENVCEH